MKINSKLHGIIDYLMVIFLWLSPSIFGMPPTASIFAYGLGVIHLTVTICTNYEYGLVRFIPLKIHGTIELVVSLGLIAVAFYLDSLEGEFVRNFYLCLAVGLFLFWFLSDYTNKPEGSGDVPYIESSTDGGMI